MKRFYAIALAVIAAGCSRPPEGAMLGYGEAEYVYLASQESGVVAELFVREGDAVDAGAPVFRLQGQRIDLPLQGATAQRAALAQAVEAARAQSVLARSNYQRTNGLFQDGFVARARLDADRAALDAASAQLEQARRQWAASNAEIGLWRQRRSDLAGAAPTAGTIERIYRRPGEVVAAGQPIAALLTPENRRVRFFAPEAEIAHLPPGARVALSCDGCANGLMGTVSFVAREPQFTPPVIYSVGQREKLVYLIEARPDDPSAIRPGLPVDVRLAQ